MEWIENKLNTLTVNDRDDFIRHLRSLTGSANFTIDILIVMYSYMIANIQYVFQLFEHNQKLKNINISTVHRLMNEISTLNNQPDDMKEIAMNLMIHFNQLISP